MYNFLQWLKLKSKYIRYARITYAERKATEIKLGKILEIRIVTKWQRLGKAIGIRMVGMKE